MTEYIISFAREKWSQLVAFVGDHKDLSAIIGTVIVALLGWLAVWSAAKINAKTKRNELLIQIISSERIKWINSLRDEFVNFNIGLLMYREEIDLSGDEISDEERKRYESLITSINKITLLLNPSEYYMGYLIVKINELAQVSSTLRNNHGLEPFYRSKNELKDLQQIILKAEWKRVKLESKKGKELKSKKTNKIYNDIAEGINENLHKYVKDWAKIDKRLNRRFFKKDPLDESILK